VLHDAKILYIAVFYVSVTGTAIFAKNSFTDGTENITYNLQETCAGLISVISYIFYSYFLLLILFIILSRIY
jgi:hypothetical protein